MIDITHLKEHLDHYKKKLDLKGYAGNLDEIISKHESKNNIQVKLDDVKNKKNVLSKEIGTLTQTGKSIDEQKKQSEKLSNEIQILQEEFDVLNNNLEKELLLSLIHI